MRKKTFSAFLKEARGSIATIGAVAITAAVAAVAMSVTVAHIYETKADIQRALDAALLSAARSLEYNNPQPIVQRFLEAYVRDAGIPAQNLLVDAHYDESLGVLVGNVKFRVNAIFPIPTSINDHVRPRVDSQVTPQGTSRLEIAFALDMSGSMEELLPDGRTTRIQGLKTALNDLFILIGAEQQENALESQGESKVLVSIVPYATSVNIGNLYTAVGSGSLRGNAPAAQAGPAKHAFFAAPKASDADYRKDYYGLGKRTCDAYGRNCDWEGAGRETVSAASSGNPNPAVAEHLLQGVWATERVTPGGASMDATPRDSLALKYASYKDVSVVMRERLKRENPRSTVPESTFHRSWATPAVHPLPLTDNLDDLRAYAKNLTAYGGTSGHIGMEWAWYSIAPNWGGVWAYRPTNASGQFQKVDSILPDAALAGLLDNLLDGVGQTVGSVLDLVGGLLGGGGSSSSGASSSAFVNPQMLPAPYDAYNTTKVIVLMTDGLFSAPLDTGAVGTSSNSSYAHFQKVCSAAKEKGVIIYTIAFSDDAEGTDQLRRCASQSANYFESKDTEQLSQAFRKIFVAATNMHVSR